MASPTFFARGHTPTPSDTRWFILQRILGAIDDLTGGGGSGGSVLVGLVDPEGVVAAEAPALYVNRANRTVWFKETGAAGTTTFWQQYI